MTPSPKEKAKELVEQYMDIICPDGGALSYKQQQWIRAKQCAIFHCDEVISVIDRDANYQNVYAYFLEVKTEIELL